MTAASLTQISIAPAAGSAKTPTQPAGAVAFGQIAFKDLLGTARDGLKDDSETPEEHPKHEPSLTLSAIAAIFAAMLPAAPAGSFGLPSQGDEAGPASQGTGATAQAKTQTPETDVPVDAEGSQPENSGGGPQPELAFALRLTAVAIAPAAESPANLDSAPKPVVAVASLPVEAPKVETGVVAELKPPTASDPPPQSQSAVASSLVEVTADTPLKLSIHADLTLKPDSTVAPSLPGVSSPVEAGSAPKQVIAVAPLVDLTKAAMAPRASVHLGIDSASAPKPAIAVAPLPRDVTRSATEAAVPLKLSPGPTVSPTPAITKAAVEVGAPSRLPADPKPELAVAPRAPEATNAAAETGLPLKSKPQPAALAEQAPASEPAPTAPDSVTPPAGRNTTIRQTQATAAEPQLAAAPAVAPADHADNRRSMSDNHSSAEDGPASKPKPQPKAAQPDIAAAEPAPAHHPGSDTAPENAGPKEPVAQMPSPVSAIAIASPAISGAPDAPNRIALATPSEPSTPAAPTVRPNQKSEVTEVSLTVPGAGTDSGADERIAIRMVQRGGEIHVAVRTPDQQTAQSMRQDLSRLAASLDDAGLHADTWRPGSANIAAPASAHGQHEFSQESRQGDTAGSDAQSDKHDGRGSGEQKQRQQDQRPRWVAELEEHGI